MSKDSDIDLFALKEAVASILQDLNLRLYTLEADSDGYSGDFERCKNYIEELRDLQKEPYEEDDE